MILIDMNNLCMREAYAKAGLTHHGRPSGVIYGVLRQIRLLMDRFRGEVCCCWDAPRKTLLRRRFWPGYKANREGKQMPEAVLDAYPQMELLRKGLLPRLGLVNQMFQDGYEADDLIAGLSMISSPVTIVSSDSDLFQLLGPRCYIYNLGKKANYTYRDFMGEYGVSPYLWTEIKAIAGDNSDGIDGVPGIGIKTAVKYVCGAAKFKTMEKVASYKQVIERNRALIRLPWPGCRPGEVRMSRFDEREFMRVCSEWGLRSLG